MSIHRRVDRRTGRWRRKEDQIAACRGTFSAMIACGVIAFTIGVLFAGACDAEAMGPPLPVGTVYVGDSITLGLDVEVPFPVQLLGQTAAQGGLTTLQAYTRWPFLIGPELPVLRAHLLLGAADAGFDRIGPGLYRERILFLIARLHLERVRQVWVSTPPHSTCPSARNDLIDAYHEVLVGIVADYTRVYYGADLRRLPPEFFADCVHPNQTGHDWIAEKLR